MDGTLDAGRRGAGLGTQNIAQSGLVTLNGRVDSHEYQSRKTRKSYSPAGSLYGGEMTDDVFSAYPGDLALMVPLPPIAHRSTIGLNTNTELVVFTALNGAGDASEGLQAFQDKVRFAGLVDSNGATYDSTGSRGEASPGVSLQVGGLRTIVNNGPDRIRAGDTLMWEFQDPDRVVNERARKHSPRILPDIRRYEPTLHHASAEGVKDSIVQAAKDLSNGVQPQGSQTASSKAAAAFNQAMLDFLPVAADILLRTGFFGVDPDETDPQSGKDRARNADDWNKHSDRQRVLQNIAAAFCNSNVATGSEEHTYYQAEGQLAVVYAAHALAADSGAEIGKTGLDGHQPAGDVSGVMLTNQRSLVTEIVGSVENINAQYRRRCFATAQTSARPAEEMDILLGASYQA